MRRLRLYHVSRGLRRVLITVLDRLRSRITIFAWMIDDAKKKKKKEEKKEEKKDET
jgi:hypothetical protein